MQTSWKVIEESRGRKKMWLNNKKRKKNGLRGRIENKNAKTEGVSAGWQLPHVQICCSPSKHFSVCSDQSWWSPLRGRQSETKWQSEWLARWQASLASPSCLTLLFFFTPFFSTSVSVCFCIILSHNPPLDIFSLQSVPRSKSPWPWCV